MVPSVKYLRNERLEEYRSMGINLKIIARREGIANQKLHDLAWRYFARGRAAPSWLFDRKKQAISPFNKTLGNFNPSVFSILSRLIEFVTRGLCAEYTECLYPTTLPL